MFPESQAPELPGLEEFRRWAEDKPVDILRHHEVSSEGEGWWQVYMRREERRFDDKLYMHVITVDDDTVSRCSAEIWDTFLELCTMGWENLLYRERVSDEDERIHEIRDDLDKPVQSQFNVEQAIRSIRGDVRFLLEVVDRLKEKEATMQEAIELEWQDAREKRALLLDLSEIQPKVLSMIRENGFVFDDIGAEPGNWKHLAFSLYTEICEVDTRVRQALEIPIGPGAGQ